jgi:UDP-N-acetylglucosamine acyltransferase
LIHPTAIIDEAVRETLPEDISIGAYAIIEADVSIGPGCSIGHHAVIKGPTRIGADNRIFQFASIGEEPQDLKFHGEPTQLIIGDRNTFREFTTINRGTVSGIGRTEIGNDNLLMAYVHVAHDCIVGNHVIFSNSASLAGHVEVRDHAILSGFTLVHQFCNVGEHAFTGMGTALNRDLPPYVIATGNYARPIGINKEGLKRRGFSPELIQALHKAFRLMIKSRRKDEAAIAELVEQWQEVAHFKAFIDSSRRGIIR